MAGEILKIEEVLEREGVFIGPTKGVSMRPLLKTGRDTIVVKKKEKRLSPLDVALYRRGADYVLHRVLQVTDTGYIIRGDNCYEDEVVQEDLVIGVLTEFFRKNKHYFVDDKKYLSYVHHRLKNYPLRRFFVRLKGKIRRAFSKVKRLFLKIFGK